MVLNILLIALPISGWERVSQRYTYMVTINLVPLLLRERLYLIGKICRILLILSALSYRVLGIITVVDIIIYIVIMACHYHFGFYTRPDWGAILVGNTVSVKWDRLIDLIGFYFYYNSGAIHTVVCAKI